MLEVVSDSVEETIALGEKLGAIVGSGDFIILAGELGSGKTHFSRGVATGLGADPSVRVTSPTYTLMNVYQGRLPLYHFDLYRLVGDQDVAELGFEEYFFGAGVCLVEWGERLRYLLPEQRLTVYFAYADEDSRRISFEPYGTHYEEIVKKLTSP